MTDRICVPSKKKIVSIVISSAALLLTLAGCGPKTASAGNASGGNAYYASAGNYYASYGNASSGNAG